MQEAEHVVQSLEAMCDRSAQLDCTVRGAVAAHDRDNLPTFNSAAAALATSKRGVGEVWRKIGVVGGCGAEAGFVPGGWADINKLAHRMTGWEGIWGAKGVNGDKGEMPVRLGGCQQVGRRSCWRIARILDRALKSLGTLVAIRVEGTPGVAALPCRSEQAVGKLATNEDHRNPPLKSLNNKIQYLDS
jgi:hypothetical protein